MESPPGLGSGPLSLGCVEVDPPYMAFPSHQDFRRVVVAAPFRKIFFQFLFFIFFHSFFIFFNFPQFFPILFPILFLILPFFLFLPQFFSIFFTDLFPDFLPFFHNFSIFPISFKCFFPQIPRFGEATEITSCSPVTPDVLVTPIPVPPPPSQVGHPGCGPRGGPVAVRGPAAALPRPANLPPPLRPGLAAGPPGE